MSVETIARRYATALADVVIKTGETDAVKAELKAWQELISANVSLRSALGNPAIAHTKKEKVLEGLIARTKPTRTTANFLRVLVHHGRLMVLGNILSRFDSVLEERGGILSAEVASARELNDAQRNELKTNLEKRTGKRVKLGFVIDPDLIGGVVTRVGSTVYDGSVRTQLENLRQQMTES